MKRNLLVLLLLATFAFAANVSAACTTTFDYSLDIDIPNPGMITEIEEMIGGVQFKVENGTFGTDWNVTLGDAVPQGQGNWIFENFGTWNAAYDDYNWSNPDYSPLGSGNVLTISSCVELLFTDLDFYDFSGGSVNPDYFVTAGFTQGEVPIPGTLLLFGSGLLGFLGLKRRKQ
ncbi:MAG: PEP-CTERM sorting domain-containing protein [Desulfobacteraceae bacterium]|nr:PEP-CTERM sorting domain-containing protein [Desulfobacteraceae bacterium]